MLYFALIVSAVLLLVVNLIAWIAEHPRWTIGGASFIFGGASVGFLCITLPPVLFQAILIGGIVAAWGARRWRPAVFLLLSCTATLLVYGVTGYLAFRQTRQLLQKYPVISLEERLRQPLAHHSEALRLPAVSGRFAEFESRMESESRMNPFRMRALRRLHEGTLAVFVNQPGFGVTRMSDVESLLRTQRRQETPIPQPGTLPPSPWLPESLSKVPDTSREGDKLNAFHEASVVEFVNSEGFGFVKDRRHVAGFQEHQFKDIQTPPPNWSLQRIDLIGLVVHKEPVVYVSEFLPRMDELRAASTRPVDEFEAAGLRALERGEELFVRDQGRERRMLGAIRAVRQCLSCHDGERGDLLGAFAYRLTR